jgi:hypothetical protein
MSNVHDPASMIEAAQTAASNGDYPAAEALLREAAAIQEASLGAEHPDLATTLNNLAFVCERTDKLDEAERNYRRAHAIAVASLSPGHPFIKTSLSNLVEFCAARGVPIWKPPAAPAEDEIPDADFAPEPDLAESPEAETVAGEPIETFAAERTFSPRTIAVAAVAVAAIVIVFFTRQGQGTTDPPRSAQPVQQPAETVASPPVSGPGPEPRPEPRPEPVPEPVLEPGPERGPEPRPEPGPEPRPEPGFERGPTRPLMQGAPIEVLKAQLCSDLERRGSPDWQCVAARGDGSPGTYVFYTRLQTSAETRVEHRWYWNNRLHQTMRLTIPASGENGYRTFSSNRVIPERAGEWRVELRARDGSVLHEERFVVR